MAFVSVFTCGFCLRRVPLPVPEEGEVYKTVDTFAVIECQCGAVGFCQADAPSPESWSPEEAANTLCVEVLKLARNESEIRMNHDDTTTPQQVVWALPKHG